MAKPEPDLRLAPVAPQSLYEAITLAGITTDHHESDLYFPVTDKSTEILNQFPDKIATTFAHSGSGAPWFDVPFAYLPWWKAKGGKK